MLSVFGRKMPHATDLQMLQILSGRLVPEALIDSCRAPIPLYTSAHAGLRSMGRHDNRSTKAMCHDTSLAIRSFVM